jgi:ribosomal protein S13
LEKLENNNKERVLLKHYYKGKLVNNEKNVLQFLKLIFGISFFRINKFCKEILVSPNMKMKYMSSKQFEKLIFLMQKNYKIEKDLIKINNAWLNMHFKNKSYYTFCFKNSLPVNGQSARINGKTAKKMNSVIYEKLKKK